MNAETYNPAFLSGSGAADLDNEYVFVQDIAIGYYSADIFLHDLQKAGKNLSRDGFLSVANDGSTYQVPGGIGAVSFPADHTASVPCGSLVQINNGKYEPKVPLTCFKNVPLSVLG